jgi:hypothetical protein
VPVLKLTAEMKRALRSPDRSLLSLLIACAAAGVWAAAAAAVVPSNTTAPTVSGAAREGQTLTAANGTWANNPTSFQYQWQRCSAAGADCAGIASATNMTYTLAGVDVDHRLRVVVTAVNADGQSSANSAATDVVSGGNAPVNTAKPTIEGSAIVGDELTASNGTWTGGATSFSFQWQRCDTNGGSCTDVTDATSRRYGVRTADVGHRIRVAVTAKNASSSSTATSEPTALARASGGTTATPNRAPTISFLSLRRSGARVFARFRVCDDGFKPITIVQRDVKAGARSYTRRYASLARPCRTTTRNWTPPARFRHGRYTATLRAVDKSGRSSPTVSRTIFYP